MQRQFKTSAWLKDSEFSLHGMRQGIPLKDYIDEIDEETWEAISLRPCNRA